MSFSTVQASHIYWRCFTLLSFVLVAFLPLTITACVPSSSTFSTAAVSASKAELASASKKDVFADEYLAPRIVKRDVIEYSSYARGLDGGTLVTGKAGHSLLLAYGLGASMEADAPRMAAASAGSADYIEPEPVMPVSVGVKSGITGTILTAAYGQTGRSYKVGGGSPSSGFDAAGFTRWAYSQKGVSISKDIKRQASGGKPVPREDLRPGDLLVYRNAKGGSHVGIYTGNGNIIHAAAKTGVVTETAAFDPQMAPYFVGGRRYYDDPKAAPLSDEQKMAATSMAVKTALADLSPGEKRIKSSPKYSKNAAAGKSKKGLSNKKSTKTTASKSRKR